MSFLGSSSFLFVSSSLREGPGFSKCRVILQFLSTSSPPELDLTVLTDPQEREENKEHQEKKEFKGQDKMVPWRQELGRTNWISLLLEMMMLSQCLTMITQGGPGVGTRVQPSYLEPPILPLLEKGSSRTLGSCFTKSQH